MSTQATQAMGLVRLVEQMIAFDRLSDAIDLLLAVTARDSTHRNELIQHSGSLRRLDKNERLGFATAATAEARARLTHSILELSKLLEDARGDRPVPRPADPVVWPSQVSLEKIIGANNLKKIAWLEQGLRCAASVGRIVCRGHVGTGFLIAQNRVVTNHHVIASAREAGDAIIEFNYQEDLAGKLLQHFAYRLDPERFWTDERLDVSVVGVVESDSLPPLAKWGTLELNPDQAPAVGDHVSIVQHPEGGVKQIACTANQVVNIFEHRLQYLTDTLPGASGAPVFDDKWKIVAIHHAGGDMSTNVRGDTRYVNEGILVGRVMHLLAS